MSDNIVNSEATAKFRETLEDLGAAIGMRLTVAELEELMRYYELVVDWNMRINLTGITEPVEFAVKHIIDSLYLFHFPCANKCGQLIGEIAGDMYTEPATADAKKMPPANGLLTLLDMGTGAGLPGVPLKLHAPQLRVTLVDSLRKRTTFLELVRAELGIEGLDIIHSRAEDIGRAKAHRERYNFVTSRAVASLPLLLEYTLPLVKVGGCFLAFKGGEVAAELNSAARALEILGSDINSVEEYSFELPLGMGRRTLLAIPKLKLTPKIYPRKTGIPEKNPLL